MSDRDEGESAGTEINADRIDVESAHLLAATGANTHVPASLLPAPQPDRPVRAVSPVAAQAVAAPAVAAAVDRARSVVWLRIVLAIYDETQRVANLFRRMPFTISLIVSVLVYTAYNAPDGWDGTWRPTSFRHLDSLLLVALPVQYGEQRIEAVSYPSGATVGWLKGVLSHRLGLPPQYLVLYHGSDSPLIDTAGRRTGRAQQLRLDTPGLPPATQDGAPISVPGRSMLQALIRPLRGDHYHIGYSVYVGGERTALLRDRPTQQQIAEGAHALQLFPHTGVHAGGAGWFADSMVHVHPGTMWQWSTASEGLGCTLGTFLESSGILVSEADSWRYPNHFPLHGMVGAGVCLEFPAPLLLEDGREVPNAFPYRVPDEGPANRTHVCNNETMLWRAYVWDHVDAPKPVTIVEEGFDRLWLPYARGLVSLSFEPRSLQAEHNNSYYRGVDSGYPLPAPATIAATRKSHAGGFDGHPYPMPQ